MLSEQEFIKVIKNSEPMSRYVEHVLKEAYKYVKPHLQQPPHLHRTSRQEVKIWFDDHVETMGFRPGALVIWKYFESHLQPFDREAYKELLRSLPHIIALNHVKELLDSLKALHTGGSEPDDSPCNCPCHKDPSLVHVPPLDGKDQGNLFACPHCDVCDTCGGSGRKCQPPIGNTCIDNPESAGKPCFGCEYMQPCPACKSEHCPDCDWDVDEVKGSEDMLVKACKKHECQICKGSGRKLKNWRLQEWNRLHYEDCPACKPKCLRCGITKNDDAVPACSGGDGTGFHRWVDERVKQQRQGERRTGVCTRRSLIGQPWSVGRRLADDRRESERRTP